MGEKILKINQKIYLYIIFVMIFSLTIPQVCAKEYVMGEQKSPVVKPDPASTYVGSEKCKTCHAQIYEGWKTTGHPYKLLTPDEAKAFNIPFPDGYTDNDIFLVIGGWGWKSRYIDNNGYIITKTGTDRNTNGSNQYNIANQKWVDYNPGKILKFDCGNCHTTGYSLAGNQNNKPGIVGTWEEKGIGCEACHGPASIHVSKGGGKNIGIMKDNSSELCGKCHTRGMNNSKIMSKDGFIEHHEQYPEFLNSPHKDKTCVTCHDPHKGTHVGATNPTEGAGIRTDCPICHSKQVADFTGSTMQKKGVICINCHMPKVGKSAVGDAAKFTGDVREHIFKINPDPDAKMFSEDGKFSNGYLTIDFTCLSCHNNKDKAWAGQNAKGIHKFVKPETTPPKTETAPEPMTTEKSPGFELLFAVVALLSAPVFRKK